MNRYRLIIMSKHTEIAYVNAESESAARQCYIDGDFDIKYNSYTNEVLHSVELLEPAKP